MRSVLSLDSRIHICINSVISVSFHYYLLTAHPLVVVRVHDPETIQCAIQRGLSDSVRDPGDNSNFEPRENGLALFENRVLRGSIDPRPQD